jgi:hypothetical protein
MMGREQLLPHLLVISLLLLFLQKEKGCSENEVGPKLENVEPEDCLSTESLLIPSLMICKAANTWLDSGKELYVDELSQIKPQEASK